MTTKSTTQTEAAECPDCGKEVTLRSPIKIGLRVTCPHCDADLEVVETVPVELDWYYEEEAEDDEGEDEDW